MTRITTKEQKKRLKRYRKVKALLALHGITSVEIARELNVTRHSIAMVITGRSASRRIRETIARRLGKPLKRLWPEYKKDLP